MRHPNKPQSELSIHEPSVGSVPATDQKIARGLEAIFECLDNGEEDRAVELLTSLVKSSPNSPQVAETELAVYQRLGIAEKAERAASRLLKLEPENADAMFGCALASLLCDRRSTALALFQNLLRRWPNHELASEAQQLLPMCLPETDRRAA